MRATSQSKELPLFFHILNNHHALKIFGRVKNSREEAGRRDLDFLRHEIDEIELHLQKMLSLLRPQDTLTMAVRLQRQNKHPNHARYLAIVTCTERVKESALIGFDCFGDQIS